MGAGPMSPFLLLIAGNCQKYDFAQAICADLVKGRWADMKIQRKLQSVFT
jgi:hypothetical protein